LLTSTIISDSANRLAREKGKSATVAVKASKVILAVDD
jgi:molybdopterin-binding protein